MIDVEQLKQKILDLAIRGQLVPQDPNDEPASVLIDKIRAEKEALIKQGKIKRDKNESYIFKGDDNSYYEKVDGVLRKLKTPFTIPNNWSWVKLRTIMDVRDGTHDSPSYCAQGIPFVTSKNLTDTGIDYSSCKFISETDANKINERSKVDNGDIIFAMIGTIGKPVIVKKEFNFCIKNVALLKNINLALINNIWVKFFIDYFSATMKRITSSGLQPFVSLEFIRNTLIPIPPYSEQVRIVNKIEEVYSELSKIRISNQELIDLCTTLKYKILDLFFGDNCCYKSYSKNIKNFGTLISGRDLTPDSYNNTNDGVPYITGASNFENGSIIVNRWTSKPVVVSHYNDVLITCKGTIGKTAINKIGESHIARQVMAFRCNEQLIPEYVKIFFDYKTQEFQNASSSLIPGINRDVLLTMSIPVPPINTQYQIMSNIQAMFLQIAKIAL